MKKLLVLLSFLLLNDLTLASGATSICEFINTPLIAWWKHPTYYNKGKDDPPKKPRKAKEPKGKDKDGDGLDDYACGVGASYIGGGWCYKFQPVGFCNSQGLGTCGKIGNRFSQECFNVDVCLASKVSGDRNDMCLREATIADNQGDIPECNSMQGTWSDSLGDILRLEQGDGSPLITGTMNFSSIDGALCGMWDVEGSQISESNVTLHATNPEGLSVPGCCNAGDFQLTAACGVAFGTYSNLCGFAGTVDAKKESFVPITSGDEGVWTSCNFYGRYSNEIGEAINITDIDEEGNVSGNSRGLGLINDQGQFQDCGNFSISGTIDPAAGRLDLVSNRQGPNPSEEFCCEGGTVHLTFTARDPGSCTVFATDTVNDCGFTTNRTWLHGSTPAAASFSVAPDQGGSSAQNTKGQ